jgi:hypothetical protein
MAVVKQQDVLRLQARAGRQGIAGNRRDDGPRGERAAGHVVHRQVEGQSLGIALVGYAGETVVTQRRLAVGSGTIDDLTVDGSVTNTGMVMTENVTQMMVMGDMNGAVIARGSGTIDNLNVGGSIGNTGMVMTEDVTTLMVAGNMDGTVMVAAAPDAPGNLGTMSVGGNLDGTVNMGGTLGNLSAAPPPRSTSPGCTPPARPGSATSPSGGACCPP